MPILGQYWYIPDAHPSAPKQYWTVVCASHGWEITHVHAGMPNISHGKSWLLPPWWKLVIFAKITIFEGVLCHTAPQVAGIGGLSSLYDWLGPREHIRPLSLVVGAMMLARHDLKCRWSRSFFGKITVRGGSMAYFCNPDTPQVGLISSVSGLDE